jgi:CubicO group peptidase (beta-lactamase class C family)
MSAQDRIDRLLASRTHAEAPGVALALVSGGEFVHARTRGLASIEHQIPISSDTAFRIGSVSKHFAVAIALMLAREGRLDIDAPVHDYLPEAPAYPHRPTVRQLMNNTSGVPDFLELLIASGAGVQRPVTWAQSRDLVLRQTALNCVPGTEFIYSAGGFLLLCMILERIEGRPMEESLAERLFAPLGMKRSALVRTNGAVIPDMATPYIQRGPDEFVLGGWGLEASCEGGIVSTLDDMTLWAAELARPRVLGAEIVATMATPLVYANGARGTYGLGLYARNERGRRVFGHGGRMPGFRAEIACYPDDDLALVALTNLHHIDPYALAREASAAWLDLPAADVATGPQPAAGRYRSAETGDLLEIRHAAGQPVLAASSGPLPLVPIGEGWWEPVSAVWDLRLRAASGGVDAVYCGRPLRYAPHPPPLKPHAEDYVGAYRSASLGSTYHVRADARGALSVRMQGELGYYDTPLEPIAADLFRAAPADPRAAWNQPLLRFVRGADGAVETLLYSTDRTRDLIFVGVTR